MIIFPLSIKGTYFGYLRGPTQEELEKHPEWWGSFVDIWECPSFYIWQENYWKEIYYRYFRYWVDAKYRAKEKIFRKQEEEFFKCLIPIKLPTYDVSSIPIIQWKDINMKKFDFKEFKRLF